MPYLSDKILGLRGLEIGRSEAFPGPEHGFCREAYIYIYIYLYICVYLLGGNGLLQHGLAVSCRETLDTFLLIVVFSG